MIAVTFTDSINLGAILLGVVILGAIAYFRIRSGVGEVWENVAKGHEERAAMLTVQLQEATNLIGDQKQQIERLEALPNLERIITKMAESAERADDRADARMQLAMKRLESHDEHLNELATKHEERCQARQDAQLEIMTKMQATQEEMHKVFTKLNGN